MARNHCEVQSSSPVCRHNCARPFQDTLSARGDCWHCPPSFCKTICESMEGSYATSWLQIPSIFVKQFLQEYVPGSPDKKGSKKEASLEGPSGNIWHVCILGWKYSSLGFKTGWRKFATDHSLETGDIVVFRMISKGYFVVQIFGKWGLVKGHTYDNGNAKCQLGNGKGMEEAKAFEFGTKEKENKFIIGKVVQNTCNNEETKKPPKILDADNSQYIDLDIKSICPAAELFSCDTDSLVGLTEPRLLTLPLHQIAEDDQVMKSPHSHTVGKPQEPKATSLLHKKKTSVSTNKISEETEKRSNNYISKRRPVSQEELKNALHAAKVFKTTQPAFKKIMTVSHVYRGFWLSFPLLFANKYLPDQIQAVKLMDSSGTEWEAKWLGNRSNPGLSGGWRKFALDHHLEEGDVCIFELLNQKEFVLKVHIFRVVELSDGCNAARSLQVNSTEGDHDASKTPVKQIEKPPKRSPFLRKMRGAITFETHDENTNLLVLEEEAKKKANHNKDTFDMALVLNSSQMSQDEWKLDDVLGNQSKDGSNRSTAMEIPEDDQQTMQIRSTYNLQERMARSFCINSDIKPGLENVQSGMQNGNEQRLLPSTATAEIYKRHLDLSLESVAVKQELEYDEIHETTHKAALAGIIELKRHSDTDVRHQGVLKKESQEISLTKSIHESSQQECVVGMQNHLESQITNTVLLKDSEHCCSPATDKELHNQANVEGASNGSFVCKSSPFHPSDVASPESVNLKQLRNSSKPPSLSKRAQLVQSKKRKATQVMKESRKLVVLESERTVNDDDQKTHYEVERLISRRKGQKEDEFLVQLCEQVNTDETIACEHEDGAWWVPLSHFKRGFETCRL